MWFKNLQIYRLGALSIGLGHLDAALQPHAFVAPSSMEMQRVGFVPPREDGAPLVHEVNRQWLVKLCTETKLLPKGVIDLHAKARADELEEQQGFRPGRKAMRELRERITDELLPRAFSTQAHTWAWLDPVNGWLVIDAASPSKADNVVRLLLKAVDKFPLESLRVQRSPVACMTGWLESDEAPYNFTVDQDTELRATGQSSAAVRFVKHALDPEDIGRHIANGKQCTRLALTWESRVSFVLTESLTLRSVRPLDVLYERNGQDDAERFDGEFVLMTGELARMLSDLVEALGGEAKA